jgi:hypothetical protein
MSALTINGIEVPVGKDGFSCSLEESGARARSQSGKYLCTIQRRWHKRMGTALVTDSELAEALAGLINADGIGWSFDTDLYADGKGLGAVTTGTTPTVVASDLAPAPKYGVKLLKVPASATATWTHGLAAAGYTVCVWSYVSGAWHHYAKRSDYGSGYWTDGVYGVGSTTIFSATANAVTLAAGGGAAQDYDDLLYFPFLVPSTWFATLFASSTAFPKPPLLTGGGDLLAYGSTTLRGVARKWSVIGRGSLNPLHKIEFELEED